MYYELALISVAIGGGYWGWHFVRQDSLRGYGVLNLIAAALSAVGFIGERQGDSSFGIPGAIGVGAGACLLVLGPLARGFARRAAASERFGIAQRLLDVADVLAPGSGVGDEKQLLAAMREIRDGNIEQTVDALETAKRSASPEARQAIDERIAMLYLASYRWDDAIAHAEEHLFGAIPPSSDVPAPQSVALRRALGLAPPVWVELLGAYAYKGDLDQAARMLARLEEVCAGRPDAGIWVHRGRLIFLALAGRVDAVNRLVDPKRSRHMKPAARTYWQAVAHERQGEVAAAEAAYAKARAKSRGRPRVLIDQALARLPSAKPAELGPTASEVVARVEAEPPPAVIQMARPRGPWATRVIVLAMLAVAVTVSLVFGPSNDVGVLVRDGAIVRALVHDGEWWRLASSIFVHIGGVHLIINVISVWFLGRLTEELFGPWRMVAIFGVAAIGGNLACVLATPYGVSAGASGGVFGLLGALLVELAVHRKRHRAAWSRGVWGILAIVTVAELAISFVYPVTDRWMHAGGLGVGALLGLVLSPQLGIKNITAHVARVLAFTFISLAATAAVFVARTPIEASLARAALVERETATIRATVPSSWQRAKDELFDPEIYIVLLAQRQVPAGTLDAQLAEFLNGERTRAKDKEFDQIQAAPDVLVPLPAGWQGSELLVSIKDALGGRQRFRLVVAGRPDGDSVILVSLYLPETVARATPARFTKLLASIRAR